MKNRVSGLLMETGVEHTKSRLHKVGYFHEMLSKNADIDASIRLNLLRRPLRPEAANGCPVLRGAGTTSREAYTRPDES